MVFRKLIFAATLCAAPLLATAQSAPAASMPADWPSKPVRVVVPYAPGGSADTLGRLISQHLSTVFKQSFVVDNRAGGGGVIGSRQVAQTPPDGYTLVVSGIGSHVIAPVENKQIDPMADFSHIALLGGPPTVLVVNANVPVKSVRELLAYTQANKDGLSWGSPGQGTHGHLIGELFAQSTRMKQTHISYKGAGPAVADLVGGQIPAAFITWTSANAHVKTGKLRALAITADQRLTEFPDLPTFAELGWPNLTATTWFSISGPANMPPALVDRLNAEIRRGLKTDAARRQLELEGIVTQDLDAAAFTRFVKAEIDRWTPLVRSLDKK